MKPASPEIRMPPAKLKVSSVLRLETRLGGVANPRWMSLLGQIDGSRSITAAAKAAGLSYKAAWDAVDAMNNLAGQPVVRASVGGKGGGGASLTKHGRDLLSTYRAVEAKNERFLAELNAQLGKASPGLRTLGRMSMQTSARNQWAGTIVRIGRGSVNDEVEIKLAGGTRIAAVVTHESVESLGLEVGQEAIAMVKASSIMIGIAEGARLALSARNQLTGTVSRMTPGAINTEIVMTLRGGSTVAAVVTNTSARQLRLRVGAKALAVFKASSVIVATA
jgi:molybdate transport system regulatory protein